MGWIYGYTIYIRYGIDLLRPGLEVYTEREECLVENRRVSSTLQLFVPVRECEVLHMTYTTYIKVIFQQDCVWSPRVGR